MEKNGQLPFLDILLIQREINSSLSSSVYRKPTTNDRYLDIFILYIYIFPYSLYIFYVIILKFELIIFKFK